LEEEVAHLHHRYMLVEELEHSTILEEEQPIHLGMLEVASTDFVLEEEPPDLPDMLEEEELGSHMSVLVRESAKSAKLSV